VWVRHADHETSGLIDNVSHFSCEEPSVVS